MYVMRGIKSEGNILMLVNNVRMNTLFNGGRNFFWGGFSVSNIARIEIIRGPNSAIFGADAFAATINIITKTKDDINGTEIGGRLGSFNTQDFWLLHGNTWQGFDLAFSLETHKTDGYNGVIEADAQTLMDKQFAKSGVPPASLAPEEINLTRDNLNLRLDISKDDWRLNLAYENYDNLGTGISMTQMLDTNGLNSTEKYTVDLTYHNKYFLKNLDLTAKLSYTDTHSKNIRDYKMYPPGAVGGLFKDGYIYNPSIFERQTDFNLFGIYTGINKHNISFGVGYYYGDIYQTTALTNGNPVKKQVISANELLIDLSDSENIFLPEKNHKNWHILLQDTWKFSKNWQITSGLRYDKYSDFGETFNPKLSLVWQIKANLIAKLLYGRAFRTPSFAELYAKNGNAMIGNSNLIPETIDTTELAIDYYHNNSLHFALNTFFYKKHNNIQQIFLAEKTIFTYDNIDTNTGYGLEFETRWKVLNNFSLLFNYAYQHSEDGNNHNITKVPNSSAYLRTDWMFKPNFYLNTQVNWVGKRQRDLNDKRNSLEDYALVDLTLRYKNKKKNPWNFAISVRNIFNADVRSATIANNMGISPVPNDLPSNPRSFFIELRYNFK
jgi:iron complex outermembrane receptor protein